VLELITEPGGMFDNLCKVAPHFQAGLQKFADHPLVGEARGVGLIGAVELVRDKASKEPFEAARGVGAFVATRAQENGLILRALGDSVALCPPLIVTEPEIDAIFDRLEKSLDEAAVMTAGLD
jgi:4-aminobutyrate--pyruvate transaminase